MKYFQIYLSFIITKNKNKSLFEKELEGKTEIPQSKMRQVTNFTSCADKVALFCKVKHSVQTAFVRMFTVTGSGCVSLANGERLDNLTVMLKLRERICFSFVNSLPYKNLSW